jgi:hypothetical protein
LSPTRIEIIDPLVGFNSHPGAVPADILGQALGAGPILTLQGNRISGSHRTHWRLARKLGQYLDLSLVDQDGNEIQIRRVTLKAQLLRLQGDGAPTSEWIVESGKLFRVEELGSTGMVLVQLACLARAIADLLTCISCNISFVVFLPLHKVGDEHEKRLPLLGGDLLVFSIESVPRFQPGSFTIWANNTARVPARGLQAHQRCRVEGWPCLMDFSRMHASFIASSGRAVSMSLRGAMIPSMINNPVPSRIAYWIFAQIATARK